MSLKNKVRPSVNIELDKTRKMVMDFNALAEMEDVLGESALDGSIFTQEKLSKAKYLRAILYGCLKSEDESMTLEQAGQLLTIANLQDVVTAISKLMNMSVGVEEGEKGKAEK